MVSNGSPMNMTFYGKPGIGKTSAARVLLKELNADVYELNGSFNNGDKKMVSEIENFAMTYSLYGQIKVVFIDEADFLSKEAQASLRGIIERVSANTRFFLTANYYNRLTDAIISRCKPVCFDVPFNEIDAVTSRMVTTYTERLSALGYSADEATIRRIVCLYFPDLRSIANQFQLELDHPGLSDEGIAA